MQTEEATAGQEAAGKEVTEGALDCLFIAVRLAKEEQIRTVVRLKERMLQILPGRSADIDGAISAWARHQQRVGLPKARW